MNTCCRWPVRAWHVSHDRRRLYLMYRLIRRTRGPIASLVALYRYWKAPLPF
jgi:hypothetical protein